MSQTVAEFLSLRLISSRAGLPLLATPHLSCGACSNSLTSLCLASHYSLSVYTAVGLATLGQLQLSALPPGLPKITQLQNTQLKLNWSPDGLTFLHASPPAPPDRKVESLCNGRTKNPDPPLPVLWPHACLSVPLTHFSWQPHLMTVRRLKQGCSSCTP